MEIKSKISLPDCPADLRVALSSPIPSIRTPFTPSGEIDFDGVRAQIDFDINGGAKTVMITWGDSLHSVMTDDEVARLAKVVVEHTRGRAKVIAADNIWPTRKAVAFAEYCKEIGADLLMLMPPDWGASTTCETIVQHFNAVGEHMPVMLVTAFFEQSGVFGARPGSFRMDVIRALLERVPNMVAIKDDVLGDFGFKLCTLAHDRWAIVSGGWMFNHTQQVPYGVDGYLALFMSYKPQIDWQYWNAIQTGDFDTAWKIIREIEMPVRDFIMSFEGGFNSAVHGMFELFGICGRHLPRPYHTLTDEQMEKLATFFKTMRWL